MAAWNIRTIAGVWFKSDLTQLAKDIFTEALKKNQLLLKCSDLTIPELEKLLYINFTALKTVAVAENDAIVCKTLEILESLIKNYEKLTDPDYVLYIAVKAALINRDHEEQAVKKAACSLIKTIQDKNLWPRFTLFYRMIKRVKYGKVFPK